MGGGPARERQSRKTVFKTKLKLKRNFHKLKKDCETIRLLSLQSGEEDLPPAAAAATQARERSK